VPRWPRGLHAQGVRNTGGQPRRPPVTSQDQFTQHVRAPIGNGTAQGIVAGNGQAILALGPQGVGTRWYPSEVIVSTSSGPADQSECVLYRQFIDPKQEIARTAQGGGDPMAFTASMQPGDLIYAMWQRANPGDLATITMHGDQIALMPE
jgi:hypothetical protein